MIRKQPRSEKKKNIATKQIPKRVINKTGDQEKNVSTLVGWQHQIGNRALQRLLAQRSGEGSFQLDDETTNRIDQQRGGGQNLDSTVQANMAEATGHDFSGVKVHTGPEANALNEQLNARAFTTGQDIFFRESAYQPGSSSGQELIAHELSHVVQQSSGVVGGSSGNMTVNPPGDRFEQEADASARQVVQAANAPQVQRQAPEEEEGVQAKLMQRAELPEEEEVQAKLVQREAAEEEEEVQTKLVQREAAEEEEETVQAQEMDEEDEKGIS